MKTVICVLKKGEKGTRKEEAGEKKGREKRLEYIRLS
jgi:hypothetical protein